MSFSAGKTSYVELHARSAFSFLRGASPPEGLAAAASEAGLPAMALCDRDGVYGIPRFTASARERGVYPITGCEVTLEDETVLPVLAAGREGYRNLCRLLTTAKLRSPKGEARVCWEELGSHAGGLVALTGDREGPLYAAWRRREVRACLDRLVRAFGKDNIYIEVQRHLRREDRTWERFLCDLADAANYPLLATNGVGYATPRERRVYDVFTCLRHGRTLDTAGRLLAPNHEGYIKSPAEMETLFADRPDALANTVRLAERLEFSLDDLGYRFPDYTVAEGETTDSYLAGLTWAGARERYKRVTGAVRRQLEKELGIIARLGFSGYFLVVRDIIAFCRREGIMVQGRGSAANSAVCYALGITAVDPVGGGLLFERFLSEGRQGWPDIDLDLPSGERREKVIQEVYRRYSRRGAAMTANVITYRGRSAMREIGKVLDFPPEVLKRFSGLFAGGDYPHTLGLREQLRAAGVERTHPRAEALVVLYGQIRGLPRHLGQHSGGMIIAQGALDRIVPLENASMPGRSVAQWDKDDCEDLGIVKVDLLGLGMMAVLQDTLTLTRRRGRPVDLAAIPRDDPRTFEMLRAADTLGVFQVESRAQMATLPRMKPRTFYDLVIEVAIVRPGPIQGKMVHPYLERRAGRAPVDYIDERLRPVLERTLGVPLFQEQMLRIAMIMADFSGSEAEELRRALNFSRSPERLERVSAKLRAAMEGKGVDAVKIDRIVDALGSFALYGFPESHAISFALLAYGSAFLKAHYPVEFYCALLNNQPMGFYHPASLVQDARRRGLRVRPVCIRDSDEDCTVCDDSTLRLGFRMVKGLSSDCIRNLVAERREGPFRSMSDFVRRCRLNAGDRRRLAAIGALNVLAGDRRSALWRVERAYEQGELFAEADTRADELSPLEMMSHLERLQADHAGLGLTTGVHPVHYARQRLEAEGVVRAGDLAGRPHGSLVRVAGSVICRQRPGTASGFVFISLEDETGIANVIVRPALFEARRLVVTHEPGLLITGRLQHVDGVIAVKASRIAAFSLPEANASPGASHDFR